MPNAKRNHRAGAPRPAPVREELDNLLANAEDWLDSPNSLFGGRRPVELIGTSDEQLLWDMINRVKPGFIS